MMIVRSLMLSGLVALGGFAGRAAGADPIRPVAQVDLSRYMGRWHVVAAIPTSAARGARDAVETYRRNPDRTICTWYRLRRGSSTAPVKLMHSTASIVPGTGNAEWSVHLYWLLRVQYKVGWLKPDYSQVMVVRDQRDHLWYMARTPQVSDADYRAMLARARAMGYDPAKIVEVPQQWPETSSGSDSFAGACP